MKELARCRELLGQRHYALLVAVVADGKRIAELCQVKRQKITMADNLRHALADLAAMWELGARPRPASRSAKVPVSTLDNSIRRKTSMATDKERSPWSAEEEERLRLLVKQRKGIGIIAVDLQRDLIDVRERAIALGLRWRRRRMLAALPAG